ncbi:MAG: hypothetical protein R6T98_09665, partial [Desulfatiglandales bacterium]
QRTPAGGKEAFQRVVIEDHGKSLALRTECRGTCGRIFQAVGVAIPLTIREIYHRSGSYIIYGARNLLATSMSLMLYNCFF